MRLTIFLIFIFGYNTIYSQDLSIGLIANDLEPHPMQDLAKPAYLETVVDPSFGTTIRRITDAGQGETMRTMYSTVQAWNADETRMILYKRPGGFHILLDGNSYQYIRNLDINPADLEEVFWHFNDPDILFYMDAGSADLIEYNIETDTKNILANLRELSGCTENMESGNDVQMMSWDSELFTFRCGNSSSFAYHIPSGTIQEIVIDDIQYASVMPFPSGQRFLHTKDVYNSDGTYALTLDIANGGEHSCIGRDAAGNDAYFSVAFAESPNGGCLGEVIAYDPLTSECRTIVGTDLGYEYTKSGTHISALAHKNTEGGWLVASMVGYDQDGQDLLDQELLIAQVNASSSNVYRIAHHRSDEDQYDYWGEPHPVMSPTGTRVLFNSDWSGADDGFSVDAYVVELPAYEISTSTVNNDDSSASLEVYPNPFNDKIYLTGIISNYSFKLYDSAGKLCLASKDQTTQTIHIPGLDTGFYYLIIQQEDTGVSISKKLFRKN